MPGRRRTVTSFDTPPDDSNAEDDRLMVCLQSGDREAFEQICDRHSGPLFGFFLKNTTDRELAEDLTQETLLRVYNQFWDYLPVGRFRGWLYRIARNLLIDSVRRRSHDCLVRAVKGSFDDGTDILSTVAGDVLSAEQHTHHAELAGLVDRFLDDLPAEQRLTFTLHHFAGLSLPEIADVLESSVPTTKSRLRLAREKLRDRLLAAGIPDPGAQADDESPGSA